MKKRQLEGLIFIALRYGFLKNLKFLLCEGVFSIKDERI